MIYKSIRTLKNIHKIQWIGSGNFDLKALLTRQQRNYRHEDKLVCGGTIPKLKDDVRCIMGVEKGYKPVLKSREYLNEFLIQDQHKLPKRTIKNSFLYGFIPLSTDEVMQDKYVSDIGEIRSGRLMEDLDIFAVMVLQKYIYLPNLPDNAASPYTIATALVRSIHFTDYKPKSDQDIRISGYVSWVGKSSASIIIWLEQLSHDTWKNITHANIFMVARDATNSKSAVINPLTPANKKEENIIELAAASREKFRTIKSLTKSFPTIEEQDIIHKLYLNACGKNIFCKYSLPPEHRWMMDSQLSHTVFSFPEDRNLHNTVFGGYIMKTGIELSRALCMLYSKLSPILVGISDITFHKPIAVGSIIKMNAHVVYTNANYVQVVVDVAVHKMGKSNTTNTLHITYKLPELAPSIIPYTYAEGMMYIDGLRHFNQLMQERTRKLERFYTADNIP